MVFVLEAPDKVDGRVVVKPVGHAVWNMAVLTEAIGLGTYKSLHDLSLLLR